MGKGGQGLSYGAMKWGLLAVLFCIAPAPVIVFGSFMTGPVIFVAASMVSLIGDAIRPGGAAGVEIVGYFAVHLAIYLFLYGFGASLAAWALSRIPGSRARGLGFAGLLAAMAMVGFAPLYGGAGLHGNAWGSLGFFFRILNRSHFGPNAALTTYEPAALMAGAALVVWLVWRRRASGKGR